MLKVCVHITSVCVCVLSLQSCPALQAPLSVVCSRQECWSGLPFPSPWHLPGQGSNPGLLHGRQILYGLSHRETSATRKRLLVCTGLSLPVLLVAGAAHSAPGPPPFRDHAYLKQSRTLWGRPPTQDRPLPCVLHLTFVCRKALAKE